MKTEYMLKKIVRSALSAKYPSRVIVDLLLTLTLSNADLKRMVEVVEKQSREKVGGSKEVVKRG